MNPLAQLKDVHTPGTLSWWPPALGWWLVLLLSVVLLFFMVRRRWQTRTLRQLRKKALLGFNTLHAQWQKKEKEPQPILQDLSVLIRQIAVVQYPKSETAGLHGQAWLEFLDRSSASKAFTEGAGQLFAQGPYQALPPSDLELVFPLVRRWILLNTKVLNASKIGVKSI